MVSLLWSLAEPSLPETIQSLRLRYPTVKAAIPECLLGSLPDLFHQVPEFYRGVLDKSGLLFDLGGAISLPPPPHPSQRLFHFNLQPYLLLTMPTTVVSVGSQTGKMAATHQDPEAYVPLLPATFPALQ